MRALSVFLGLWWTLSLGCLPFFAQSAKPAFSRVIAQGALPSGRFDPPIVYDGLGRRLLMFGGQDTAPRNDLWAFSPDSREWTELKPSGDLPPARFGHSVVFDMVRRRLILFGGQAGGFFSDVWAYDIARNTWQKLADDGAGPSRRYAHSAIYDAARDRLVISHGFTNAGRFDDTWAFSLSTATWQNITPSAAKPLRRCLHHAVYDERNNQMLLFGGCSSGFGPCPLNDLWSFNLITGAWIELTATPKPPARQWAGMAFDGLRGRLVLFGGSSGAGSLNDTWEYDTANNSWTQLSPGGEIPAARSRHEGTFVPALAATFFFGGQTDAGLSNELWTYAYTGPPAINAGGVVNGASFAPGAAVASGSIVSVFGSNLAESTEFAGSLPLPTTLGGATLRFNNSIAVPKFFASPMQINLQAPWELIGQTQASLTGAVGGLAASAQTVNLAAVAPGLFAANARGSGQGAILNAQGRLVDSTAPARAGEALLVFCTGLGEVTNRPATGTAAPASPLSSTLSTPTVTIGGLPARVTFSGLAPGFVGLYQVNVEAPASASPSNSVPVVLSIGGATSNTVTIVVQ